MGLEVFNKETSSDCLSRVSCDSNEPDRDCVYNHDKEEKMPEGEIIHSDVSEQVSKEGWNCHHKDQDHEAYMLDRVVVAHKFLIEVTQFGALSSGVAVGDAWEIDIGINVSANQVEYIVQAEAVVLTAFTCAITDCLFVAC